MNRPDPLRTKSVSLLTRVFVQGETIGALLLIIFGLFLVFVGNRIFGGKSLLDESRVWSIVFLMIFVCATSGVLLFAALRKAKFHIVDVSMAGGVCTIEYLKYNRPVALNIPLHDLTADLEEKRTGKHRNRSVFRLVFFRGSDEILYQSTSRWWSYERLAALKERITSE